MSKSSTLSVNHLLKRLFFTQLFNYLCIVDLTVVATQQSFCHLFYIISAEYFS